MTWRTPSSLKWLITKRARLHGELRVLDVTCEQVKKQLLDLERKAEHCRRTLAALDETIGLHEIQVCPEDIEPVHPNRKQLLPPGQLTRLILSILRTRGSWLSTTDMFHALVSCFPGVEEIGEGEIRMRLRRRLRNMSHQGTIERRLYLDENGHHDGATEALWRIPPW